MVGPSVRVVEARPQVTSGDGPGALAGQPQTVLRLELVDGSAAPLVLDAVVVQAADGDPATQADSLGAVTVSVDVDGDRFPSVFSRSGPGLTRRRARCPGCGPRPGRAPSGTSSAQDVAPRLAG